MAIYGFANDNVNLRNGPSTTTDVLGVVAKGAQLELLGPAGDFLWVKTPDSKVGYVAKQYVDTPNGVPATTVMPDSAPVTPAAPPAAVPEAPAAPAAPPAAPAAPAAPAPVTPTTSTKLVVSTSGNLNVRSSAAIATSPDNKI